jgi:hypothetical protein
MFKVAMNISDPEVTEESAKDSLIHDTCYHRCVQYCIHTISIKIVYLDSWWQMVWAFSVFPLVPIIVITATFYLLTCRPFNDRTRYAFW